MKARDRLRVALQKSGRLTEPALDLLTRCGLTFRQSRDRLGAVGGSQAGPAWRRDRSQSPSTAAQSRATKTQGLIPSVA